MYGSCLFLYMLVIVPVYSLIFLYTLVYSCILLDTTVVGPEVCCFPGEGAGEA